MMDPPFVPSPPLFPSPFFFPPSSFSPLNVEIRAMMQQQQQQANANLQVLLDVAERYLNDDPTCVEALGGGPLRLGPVYSQSTSYVSTASLSSSSVLIPNNRHSTDAPQRRVQQCRKVRVAVRGGAGGGAMLQIVESDRGIQDMVLQFEDGRQIQVQGSDTSSGDIPSQRGAAGDDGLPPDVIDAKIVTDEIEEELEGPSLQQQEQQEEQQNRWSFPFQWTKGV